MAKKKNKPAKKPVLSRAEMRALEEKRKKRTKLGLIIFAAVAAAAILTLSVIGIVSAVLNSERVDVMKDNLGKYIYLSEDDYKNYPVTIKIDPVDDMAIGSAFIQALYASRVSDETYGAAVYNVADTEPQRALGAGDVVYAHYLGYEISEDGQRIYFDGGCNFGTKLKASNSIGIGSGDFITGFELGLIGKNPWSFSPLTKVTEGTVKEGDVISFKMLAMYSDGTTAELQSYTTVVDSMSCDPIYGDGFAEFLIGRSIGEVDESFTTTTVSDKSGNSVYTDITIEAIYDRGTMPMTVEARFPVAYQDQAVAGKTVYFEVFVEKVQYYTVPEVDESFITEKLGMTVAEISAYGEAGDSLVDRYRAYLGENLKQQAAADAESAIIEEFWDYVTKAVTVKRLPRGDVNDYYNDYIADIKDYHQRSSTSSGVSLDEFAVTYLDLEAGADWRAEVRKSAELGVTEKLIFYYIIREEGLTPTEEEYAEVYNRVVDEMVEYVLKYQNIDVSTLTDEKYQEYRTLIIDSYGEEYFDENTLYEFAMSKIVAMADVKYE